MDRRTSIALALSIVVLTLWWIVVDRTMPKPLPKPIVAQQQAPARTPVATPGVLAPGEPAPGEAAAALAKPVAPAVPERLTVIETPLYRAEFSNRGARLVDFELKRFAAAYGKSQYAEHPSHRPALGKDVPAGDRVSLGGEPAFALDLGSGTSLRSLAETMYAVTESTDAAGQVRALTFTTQDSTGLALRQTWRVRPDSYLLDLEIETRGVPQAQRMGDYSLTLRSWPLFNESNYLNEKRTLRATCLVGTDLHRDVAAGMVSKAPKLYSGVAHWAAVQSHYFLAAIATTSGDGRAVISSGFQRALGPEQIKQAPPKSDPVEPGAACTLVMPLPVSGAGVQHFVACFGPSDYFWIASHAGKLELERAVDMGFSWLVPISKLLLWLLRQINLVVRNFGFTILLLATLVRLVLHPLNVSSMKSMRAMQRLQPEMERIKEKYKNDAQALNTATMALYKENGVNPAGGCLPMFLQMPLFFAMYSVISNAIDLRQASFFGWIHDLSAPDVLFSVAGFPVHVLPLLMAGTGFLSQRFTPTDPKQAPTMYMMNLVMLVVFYPMPSGLVFYWTVMNILTALQQWLSMRGDSAVVVVPVEPPSGKGRKRQ